MPLSDLLDQIADPTPEQAEQAQQARDQIEQSGTPIPDATDISQVISGPVGEPVGQPPAPVLSNPAGIVGPVPAAAPAAGGIDELLAQFGPLLEKIKQQRGDSAEKAAGNNLALATAEFNKPPAPFPEAKLQPLPTKPDFQFRDTMEAFQTPGVVLAMFGSLFTRAPITAAFRSAAAAMNGFHKGDMTLYEKAQQDYKDNLDLAIKQNGMEIETYRQALEKRNTTWAERQARLNALMAANKDVIGLASIERGDMSLVFQVLQMKENAQERAIQARALAEDRKDRRDETERHNQAIEGLRAQESKNAANRISQGSMTERDERRYIELKKAEEEGDITDDEAAQLALIRRRMTAPKTFPTDRGPVVVEPSPLPDVRQTAPSPAAPTTAAPAPTAVAASPAPAAGVASPPAGVVQPAPSTRVIQTPGGGRVSEFKDAKEPPPKFQEAFLNNATGIRNIDRAIDEVTKYAKAVGWLPWLASAFDPTAKLWDRKDPAGVDARAAITDIGSMKLHDRSGAAITQSEFPRLRAFIPSIGDDPETVVKKLKQFRKNLVEETSEAYKLYGPQDGYRPNESVEQILGPPKAAAAPPSQEDLEYTAKQRGITVDEVKRRLGIR